MQGKSHLLQRMFRHLVDVLPYLQPPCGPGNALYAIVVPQSPGEAILSGPASDTGDTAGWPAVAARAEAFPEFAEELKPHFRGRPQQ